MCTTVMHAAAMCDCHIGGEQVQTALCSCLQYPQSSRLVFIVSIPNKVKQLMAEDTFRQVPGAVHELSL